MIMQRLSPLVRGTHAGKDENEFYNRFIPAGAGNTCQLDDGWQHMAVYPRWCGEHVSGPVVGTHHTGLSPLVRGTPENGRKWHDPSRFIPAGAGNTLLAAHPHRVRSVYPRWCGEHVPPCFMLFGPGGLSPLARGTRCVTLQPTSSARFIPAGAGNTPDKASCVSIGAVYPRWCGEHRGRAKGITEQCGLSPLVRGTPCSHATA